MNDQRPIKPNQEYLDQYIKKINQIETKTYLKRRSQPVLPCQALQHHQEPEHFSPAKTKTKAQIYEEIKRKNREKFGEKKYPPILPKKSDKKINPKNITVDYKPKKIIEIQERKQEKSQNQKQKEHKQHKEHKEEEEKEKEKETKSKIQYEKLLQIYRHQLDNLQKEKDEFEKQAAKLNFKQKIKEEQGLLFSKIRSQVAKSCISVGMGASQLKQSRNQKACKATEIEIKVDKPKYGKTYSVSQIKKCIDKTCVKMQQIKAELMKQDLTVKEHRYKISQMQLLPAFNPESLFSFLDFSELNYCQNVLYKQALAAFDRKLKNTQDIKVQFVGEKRVSRYDGWYEVWIPGRQRVLQKEEEEYKVVWLNNGDVKQEFGKDISTYFSKAKGIVKIQFKKQYPLYYHHELKQIWRYLENGNREIVFANGRKQILPISS